MLLSELAVASGCSAATIKYYRREGLLPPGERITATRQNYGTRHLERLALIQVLREVADAPIPAIRRLTALLDDPSVPLIRALEEAQA
ncbi:MerR family transcriptional regulator, partial [Burkholderia multivorans]